MATRLARRLSRGRPRAAGYLLTASLVALLSILVLVLIVGVAVLRKRVVKKITDNLILDSSSPVQVLGKPRDYGICEEPHVLLRDTGNGLLVLVGVRPDRLTSRNQVFYDAADCTGEPYLAPPAVPPPDGVLPPDERVGYQNGGLDLDAGGTRVVYGVGAPASWPGCTLGVDCEAGLLYRSTGAAPAVPAPPVLSVWSSLAPDCAFLSGAAGPDLVPGVCELVVGAPTLVAAEEVLWDPGDPGSGNLLSIFTPPFFIAELEITETAPEPEAPAPAGGGPITFTDPAPETVKP